jgi:hypothetical protein
MPDSDDEYVLILLNQGILFPSVTYVRNLITKAGVKQVSLEDYSFNHGLINIQIPKHLSASL